MTTIAQPPTCLRLFDPEPGGPTAEQILRRIRGRPDGLTVVSPSNFEGERGVKLLVYCQGVPGNQILLRVEGNRVRVAR